MRTLFGWIRGFFSNKILKTLGLPKGEFILIEDDNGCHATVEETSYRLLGIIPLFAVRRRKSFSWTGFISETFQESLTRLNGNFRYFIRGFSDNVLSGLKKSIRDKVKSTREKSFASIKQAYSSLHQDFVAKVVKQSTDEFRRELLEKLKASGGEIFTKQVHQHLASLLINVKEEYRRIKDNGIVSVTSGSLALPIGTRFFIQEKNIAIYVVEQSPQMRTVKFNWNKRNGEGREYRLAFPFIVFIVTVVNNKFYSLHLFFRNQPLRNCTDDLFCPSLPNLDRDFKVCFPVPTASNGNPVKVVEETIQNFWGSEFNKDLDAFFAAAQSSFSQISSLEKWERESRNNSHFVLALNWQSAKLSVIDATGKIVTNTRGGAQTNQGAVNISALKSYVEKLGERISQEIQEACFFLVPHLSIDATNMDIATEKLKTILSVNCDNLVELLGKDIDKTFSSNLIEKELLSAIQKTETQIAEIISETETRITNIAS